MGKQNIPEKKENKATLKSKRKIRDAYLELLAENQKEHRDIRIVEIAKRANINRGTFYAYYSSIEELEKDAYESITNQLLKEVYNTPFNDILNSHDEKEISLFIDYLNYYDKIRNSKN